MPPLSIRSSPRLSEDKSLVFIYVIIGFGVLVRLMQYLFNRSLWLDEAFLSLNIMHRSLGSLLEPLDYHQGAPIGFLVLEHTIVRLFGGTEYALRLVPLLTGIAALFLFYIVARGVVSKGAVFIACGLFAISTPSIYYSSEVKQYSSDVAVVVLIYWVTMKSDLERWAGIALLGSIGAAAVWLSHPAAFVLAGIGAGLNVTCLVNREWRKIGRFNWAVVAWISSALILYFVSLRKLTHDQALLDYWEGNFMPLSPWSFWNVKWFLDAFFNFFRDTGFSLPGLAALMFIIGVGFLVQKNRLWVCYLLLPAVFALLASSFHRYPFGGRLTLFLLPCAVLFVAEGAEQLRQKSKQNSAIVGVTLLILLFANPLLYATYALVRPLGALRVHGIMLQEEMKPVIAYVFEHQKAGDVIYLFWPAQFAFRYYAELYNLPQNNVIYGTEAWDHRRDNLVDDLAKLRGKRAWIILSHFEGFAAKQAKFIETYLDATGRRRDTHQSPGATAHLYDLTDPPGPPLFPTRTDDRRF